MWEGPGVDPAAKEALVDQFRNYLDNVESLPEPQATAEPGTDLFSVFVELAAMRNEVRTESRLVKDALDQFRAVFAALESSQTLLQQQLQRQQSEARERERALLRPLLLELLDLRDRLAAGVEQAPAPAGWLHRLRRRADTEADTWREGIAITLRRLDRILADRRVVPIAVLGRPFDPRIARVVGTTRDPARPAAIVVQELRAGFQWEDELLRAAEVIVNTTEAKKEENGE
jgi:molecular chaperone GrpE